MILLNLDHARSIIAKLHSVGTLFCPGLSPVLRTIVTVVMRYNVCKRVPCTARGVKANEHIGERCYHKQINLTIEADHRLTGYKHRVRSDPNKKPARRVRAERTARLSGCVYTRTAPKVNCNPEANRQPTIPLTDFVLLQNSFKLIMRWSYGVVRLLVRVNVGVTPLCWSI